MATFKLELRYAKKDFKGKRRVMCLILDGKKVLRYPSNYSIEGKHWTKSRKLSSSAPNSLVINQALEEFQNSVINAYDTLKRTQSEVKPQDIRQYLEEGKTDTEQSLKFTDVWEEYLKAKKGNCTPTTITKFKSTYNHIIKFSPNLQVDKINTKWIRDFREYCNDPKEANLNNQTTNKYIEQIKTFLNWCVVQEIIDREQREKLKEGSRELILKTSDNKKVILTKKDLQKLRELKTEQPYLNNVKELFILSCLTGLRFSDYSTIQEQHLKQDEDNNFFLEKTQQKTGDSVRIPLTEESLTIVKRILNKEVTPISNQKVNKYLKDLFKIEELNFDEEIEINKKQGSTSSFEVLKKWELVTSHTGRRTFATLGLMEGLPEKVVMQFTGHKDYKSFAKYVNIPKIDEENMMRKALSNF